MASSADQQTSKTMGGLPSVPDEKIFKALHATGDKKLNVESLLNLVHSILRTVTDVQVCMYSHTHVPIFSSL